MVGAERTDRVYVPGMADSRHVRAEGFGDLHGEDADAARGTVDQDPLPRLDLPLIAQTLQGGQPRDRDGCCLLKRNTAWFRRDAALLADCHVLGERPASSAVYLVTWFKQLDVRPDPLDHPREIGPYSWLFWFAQPASYTSNAQAADTVPIQDVQGGCTDANQHFIAGRDRLVDFLKFEDIR